MLLALVVATPLWHLALRAAESDDPWGLLVSDRVWGYTRNTVQLGVVVTLGSLLVGGSIAILVERSDLPGRRLLGVLATLPLAVPSYVAALAIRAASGPGGLVPGLPAVDGFSGSALALIATTYPYVLLLVRGALSTADRSLEEVARSLGDRSPSVVRRVLLPQLRPALAAGSLLVFLYVVSDFGAVSILGFDTLTRAVFLEFRSLSADRSAAAVLGLFVALIAVVVVALERRMRGRISPPQTGLPTGASQPMRLRGWRWPAVGGVAAVVAVSIAAPVAVLVYWSLRARGETAGDILASAAGTSTVLGLAAAMLALLAALPIAFLTVRHRSRLARVLDTACHAGYALPGLVVGLAVVFFAVRYLPGLYQTLPLLALAYVIRFFPEALGAVRSTLTQIDPAAEEVARCLGRKPLNVAVTVTAPMLRGGALAGAALVFLTAMKELPATIVLRPAGTDTLAVRVWTGASEGLYGQAALPALLIVVVSAVALVALRGERVR